MAVADPRFVSHRKPPKPPPEWVQAGLSKSQWDKLDFDGKRLALLKAQDQGINPTGDEALPFQWGPLAAQLAKLGYSAGARQLLKRRLVKDPSGKPQPFYHGTRGKRTGDLNPTKTKRAKESGNPQQDLSTSPETADTYARGGWGYRLENPVNARIYKKYIQKLRGEDPGVSFTHLDWQGNPLRRQDYLGNPLPGPEYWARVTNAKAMISPYEIAAPPMPNFLPYLAPPVIGSQ